MILIELEGRGPRRFHLEFHPYVSVVAHLTARQRGELAVALNGAIGGHDVGLDINVDVDGVPQPLTPHLVASCGLSREPIDNILSAADIPGAIVDEGAIEDFRNAEAAKATAAEEEQETGPLAVAQAALAAATARLKELENLLATAASPADVDESALRKAVAEHEEAVRKADRVRDLLSGSEQRRETPEERLYRLRAVKNGIEDRIVELRTALDAPVFDTAEVQSALEELAQAPDRAHQVQLARTAESLAREWAEAREAMSKLESAPGPPQWVVDQAREDLEEARAQVRALQVQLEEGINVRSFLARKEEYLAQVEGVWRELDNGNHAEVEALQNRLSDIQQRAIAFLGEDTPAGLVAHRLQEEQDKLAAAPSETGHLVEVLRTVGVVANPETAEREATEWIRAQDENVEQRTKWQQELATATVDHTHVREEIMQLEQADPADAGPTLEELREQLSDAESNEYRALQAVNGARAEIEAQRRARETSIGELQTARSRATIELDAAKRKVDYFANRPAERGPVPAPPSLAGYEDEQQSMPAPWWEGRAPKAPERSIPLGIDIDVDVSRVSLEDLEMFLLAKAAGLRRLGRGESVPLLIDAAFDGLDSAGQRRIFEVFTRVAPIVQIIYMASDNSSVEWAYRQDEMVAAVVEIERPAS